MRVSVIIPALHEAAGIAQAVARARAMEPHEVIVVDGESPDATVERAREAGARVLTAPRGRGTQQNAGAAVATGDVLLFLHADTWLPTTGVRQIVAGLARRPKALHGAFAQRINAEAAVYRWLERGNALRATRLQLPYGDQGIFVRRDAFCGVGGFPAEPLMEDVALMRRLARQAPPLLLPGPLMVSPRRWQQQGVLRQTLRNWLILAAYYGGAAPADLVRWYRPHQGA